MSLILTAELATDYTRLWQVVRLSGSKETADACHRILEHEDRYKYLEVVSNFPWWWTAAVHSLESDCNWKTHLYNGDSLQHKTVNAPEGLPKQGTPPYSWKSAYTQALKEFGNAGLFHQYGTIPAALYYWEIWNGTGYRKHGIHSPYLWGQTTLSQAGKYIRDHVWSATAKTKQVGACAILYCLRENGHVVL